MRDYIGISAEGWRREGGIEFEGVGVFGCSRRGNGI